MSHVIMYSKSNKLILKLHSFQIVNPQIRIVQPFYNIEALWIYQKHAMYVECSEFVISKLIEIVQHYILIIAENIGFYMFNFNFVKWILSNACSCREDLAKGASRCHVKTTRNKIKHDYSNAIVLSMIDHLKCCLFQTMLIR